MTLGIMQGRLSLPIDSKLQAFPRDTWRKEFRKAAILDLGCIEWVYGEVDNPILDSEIQPEIVKLCESVPVKSICADYFVRYPPYRNPNAFAVHCVFLLECAAKCRHVNKIVIPFVDNSAITTDVQLDGAVEALGRVLPYARERGIQICIETSMSPAKVYSFLRRFPDNALGICYDTGNSAAQGYRAVEEWHWYGKYISHIHIKDRIRGGWSVKLGTGNANFKSIFKCIKQYKYQGDLILQPARGEPGKEEQTVLESAHFVQPLISENNL